MKWNIAALAFITFSLSVRGVPLEIKKGDRICVIGNTLRDRNRPDGTANNANINLCSDPMPELAKANGVLFVDLFDPSLELYRQASAPLTINGIHLRAAGNQAIADLIDRSLFGERPQYD